MVLDFDKNETMLQVVLTQGLNRQIRKMFDYLGHPVVSLKRIQHATIAIEGLKRGQVRIIKASQLKDLRKYIAKLEKMNND